MLFKSKEKKFEPHEHLRTRKTTWLHQGKVVKESTEIQYKNHDWDGDYWYTIPSHTSVIEVTDPKELTRMGVEVPRE